MKYDTNPFHQSDSDRYELWEMLVRKDIDAFLKQDWSLVQDDFFEEGFLGIHAHQSSNPDTWKNEFASLEAYQTSWLKQAQEFSQKRYQENPREALFHATTLRDIDLKNESALLHKKFDGQITQENGTVEEIRWQTIYQCKKVSGKWKIIGFVGYLPNPMGKGKTPKQKKTRKTLPPHASQHSTAGPYSPVLNVKGKNWVVISGQAPVNQNGKVVGETIEEQTEFTLENCKKQLQTAGVDFQDVFKVNVYLTDLELWGRFNEVYQNIMPQPYPVRTAVQAGLLYNFLVEIEMWAVRP